MSAPHIKVCALSRVVAPITYRKVRIEKGHRGGFLEAEKRIGGNSAIIAPSRLGIFGLAKTAANQNREADNFKNQITNRENVVENSQLRPQKSWELIDELVRPRLTPARERGSFC